MLCLHHMEAGSPGEVQETLLFWQCVSANTAFLQNQKALLYISTGGRITRKLIREMNGLSKQL